MSTITVIQTGTPEFEQLIRDTALAAVGAARDSIKKMHGEWDWVDEEEAMRLLSCGKTKLQQLRDSLKIEFSQPTRKHILYSRASIKKYIEKHKVKA